MTDDMRLLLRILLEQELREAEPEIQRPRKKREAEREDGIDYAPAESRGKTKRMKDTMKEERAEDFKQARSDTSIIYRSKWGRNRKSTAEAVLFVCMRCYLLISQKRMRIAATSARVALFFGFSLPFEPLTMPLATAHCIAFTA